jgi:hypothetical protein
LRKSGRAGIIEKPPAAVVVWPLKCFRGGPRFELGEDVPIIAIQAADHLPAFQEPFDLGAGAGQVQHALAI